MAGASVAAPTAAYYRYPAFREARSDRPTAQSPLSQSPLWGGYGSSRQL